MKRLTIKKIGTIVENAFIENTQTLSVAMHGRIWVIYDNYRSYGSFEIYHDDDTSKYYIFSVQITTPSDLTLKHISSALQQIKFELNQEENETSQDEKR